MINKILCLAFLFLFILVSCKKAETTAIAQEPPSTESVVEKIKETVRETLPQANATEQQQANPSGQIVYVPVESQAQGQTIASNYVSPCSVAKYRGLNTYCSFKNFWHNQSTLLSWYVPYSIVLFLLLVFLIWFAIKLWQGR